MSSSDGSNGKMLAGFILGAAIGGAMALLLAPRTGKETRDKLSKKAQDLAEAAKQELAKHKLTGGDGQADGA